MPSAYTTYAVAAVSALHATFGEAATYSAPPDDPVSCTVVLTYHDEATALPGFANEVRSPGWEARLRQTEVPTQPIKGAVITIVADGRTLTVQDVHEDGSRTEWLCDVA